MQTAIFSSLHGRGAHRDAVIAEFRAAAELAKTRAVEMQIMCFAFTEAKIAQAMNKVLLNTPKLRVNIIADWSQAAPNSPSVIQKIKNAYPAQVAVRYKIDLPYYLDTATGRAKWNYSASHGMLHHKTLCVLADGVPQTLAIGSYNWSARGGKAYENTLFLKADQDTKGLLQSFTQEFAGLWNNRAATASFESTGEIAKIAKTALLLDRGMHDLSAVRAILGDRVLEVPKPIEHQLETGSIVPAFSGRYLTSRSAHYGFAPENAARKLNLLRPSGARKMAPVTLNSVALEAIRSVPNGEPLLIAMYALSPRVPEFGAMLEAARRGCPVQVLLDGKIGNRFATALQARALEEGLPLDVRTTNRRMHQKYIVAPTQNILVTGTANMTEDSSDRHAEHRILFRNAPNLAASFALDFRTIWSRLDRNYVTPSQITAELSAA